MTNFKENILKNSTKRIMMLSFGATAILLSIVCSIIGIFIDIKSQTVIIDIIYSLVGASGFCSAAVASEYFSKKSSKDL